MLNAEEIETVDQALAEVEGTTGTALSDLSHEEVGWRMGEEGETIPFEAAYLRPAVVTKTIREHTARLADGLGQ